MGREVFAQTKVEISC